jgi:hypothetical protein
VSIDARIECVIRRADGSGKLILIDRPPRGPGENPGIAGQRVLYFGESPEDIVGLNGRDIWGGTTEIMLGEQRLALRRGYNHICFVVSSLKDLLRVARRS